MSFELNISDKNRISGRFIGAVRKALVKAAMEEKGRSGVSQQSVAGKLGVNRSVINRLLRGEANLTLRTVAEIAWALGRKPSFELVEPEQRDRSNSASFGIRKQERISPIVVAGKLPPMGVACHNDAKLQVRAIFRREAL